MRNWMCIWACLWMLSRLSASCNGYTNDHRSNQVTRYQMEVDLDHENKTATCSQILTWRNPSPDTIRELRFYMYLNAFKNVESTFIQGARGRVFGRDLQNRREEEWGWIEIDSITNSNGQDLTRLMHYIQPDDGNLSDQTVLAVPLPDPVLPGDSIVLDMHFTGKMPKIIARAGYGLKDYFLFVHWFPQPGVYEKDVTGNWAWKCHQFFQQTEFYADFGSYDVTLTVADHLTLGATGCLQSQKENGDGTTTYHYLAYDVIDFAWVVYSDFEVYEDQWKDVSIRLLVPPEHAMVGPRYIQAVKHAME